MAEKFDMLVLGSGNAGMGAAGVAQAAGKSVAVVENRDVGGTCPIRGCVPKKVLVAAAQALHQIELAPEHKITVGAAKLDWTALIEREKTFVAGVSDDFTASLESRGIKLFKGSAKFSGTNTIDVDGTEVTADKIIIATGSKPRDLPIPGFEHTINSDDILNNSTRPESLIFIGGGVIALEFSHVYARAGTQVTILEAMPQLLPRLDVDLVTRIKTDAERIGINVVTDAKINSIKDGAPDFAVEYEHDGETKIITAAAVANGAGRVADVEHLNLEAANVAHERGAIKVDEYLRSQSNPDVYAAGDVLAYAPQLSPVATYEGKLAARNALGMQAAKVDYRTTPACVYTVPAVASVGLTEREAENQGLDFSAKMNDMRSWRSARTYAETVAWAKVLIDNGTGNILGAHLIGHQAEDVIHLFAFAMKYNVPASDILETVFAYPTFSSDTKFLV